MVFKSKLQTNGNVSIPKIIRTELGLEPNDEVVFVLSMDKKKRKIAIIKEKDFVAKDEV